MKFAFYLNFFPYAGFIQLLAQLTKVGDISKADFMSTRIRHTCIGFPNLFK